MEYEKVEFTFDIHPRKIDAACAVVSVFKTSLQYLSLIKALIKIIVFIQECSIIWICIGKKGWKNFAYIVLKINIILNSFFSIRICVPQNLSFSKNQYMEFFLSFLINDVFEIFKIYHVRGYLYVYDILQFSKRNFAPVFIRSYLYARIFSSFSHILYNR